MRFLIAFICIFFFSSIEAKKTICVNMIVKDESKVITRCLGSIKPIIDYWVIVDTGSTDGTQKIIKEFMKDIPGELHESPWVNFGHNRNEALQFAKGKADYVLIIDADEVLQFDQNFTLPDLDKDFYHITTDFNNTLYGRVQLINNKLNWKWKGVLHETLACPEAKSSSSLKGVHNIVRTDGARSQDPQKYIKDAKILEAALKEEPNNSRYMFYLAQSYRDAGDPASAIKWYQERVKMGGWAEETFWAMLQIGLLEKKLELPEKTFISSLNKAYHFRPQRAEPLFYLANYYRKSGDCMAGYLTASKGLKIGKPNDLLFVQNWIYEYDLLMEFSICAYWIGRYDECQQACEILLKNPKLPAHVKNAVLRNLNFSIEKQKEIQSNTPPSEEIAKLVSK